MFDAHLFLLRLISPVLSVAVSSSEMSDSRDLSCKEGLGAPGRGTKGDGWVSVELSSFGVSISLRSITGLGREVGVNGEPRVALFSLKG